MKKTFVVVFLICATSASPIFAETPLAQSCMEILSSSDSSTSAALHAELTEYLDLSADLEEARLMNSAPSVTIKTLESNLTQKESELRHSLGDHEFEKRLTKLNKKVRIAESLEAKKQNAAEIQNKKKEMQALSPWEARMIFNLRYKASGMVLSHNSQYIFTAMNNVTPPILNLKTNEIAELHGFHAYDTIALSPDDQYVLGSPLMENAYVQNIKTGHRVELIGSRRAGCAYFSPDGQHVIVSSGFDLSVTPNYSIVMYDAKTGAAVKSFTGHSYYVTPIRFSHDGRKIVSISVNRAKSEVFVWDVNTGEIVYKEFSKKSEYATDASFSPDDQSLLIAGSKGTIKIENIENGKSVKFGRLSHNGSVNTARFSEDGQYILTASKDGRARVWTIKGRLIEEINTKSEEVLSAEFTLGGNSILTSGADQKIILWERDLNSL